MGDVHKRPVRDVRRSSLRSSAIAALDVGTSKIACLIARLEGFGEDGAPQLRVIGASQQLSRGVQRGAIVDMDAAETAIRAAIGQAEQAAGITLRSVVTALSCGSPRSNTVTVDMPLAGQAIGEGDLRQAARLARQRWDAGGQDIVHAVPMGYTVDGSRGIRDPRGMCAERLGVTMHLVTANPGPLRNLDFCIQRCHLDLEGKILAPYAAGLSALVADERDLGVTLVEMGAGTTSIAVFFEDGLLFTDVIPVGSHNVTLDLARGLSTPIAHAERLKTLYGSALASPHDDREMIALPQIGETEYDTPSRAPRSVLAGIIRPRIEEIFELVQERLNGSGLSAVAGRRVVLTGGGSLLNGAREVAARILSRQVRLGRPMRLLGLDEQMSGPAFAASAGLLHWAAAQAAAPAESQFLNSASHMFSWPQKHFTGLKRWLAGG